MGRSDGKTMAPTAFGAANPSVNAAPITTKRTGTLPVQSKTTEPSIALRTENANTEASIDTFNHAAKVGLARGRESPIPVFPARSALAGRNAASTKVWAPTRFA